MVVSNLAKNKISESLELGFLDPLLITSQTIASEERKRRKKYLIQSISKIDVQIFLDQGWELDKELKTKTRIKKLKPIEEAFENKAWCMFSKMGYPELNKGRDFLIKLNKYNEKPIFKKIDIFAKDNETIIVAKCISIDSVEKKSLKKEINEFAESKGAMAISIKKHYGSTFKPKILWLFITNNIIWSKSDKDNAYEKKIRIITQRELNYLTQIVDHLGPAARY